MKYESQAVPTGWEKLPSCLFKNVGLKIRGLNYNCLELWLEIQNNLDSYLPSAPPVYKSQPSLTHQGKYFLADIQFIHFSAIYRIVVGSQRVNIILLYSAIWWDTTPWQVGSFKIDSSELCMNYALWSPAGKGLTSWLSFVVSNCEFVTFPLVSWVRCGTSLYRFLIFAPLLSLITA